MLQSIARYATILVCVTILANMKYPLDRFFFSIH